MTQFNPLRFIQFLFSVSMVFASAANGWEISYQVFVFLMFYQAIFYPPTRYVEKSNESS